MAAFRSSVGTITASTSEITVDLPSDIVAGDLLVIYVIKPNTDEPVAPAGWYLLGDFDHGIGDRMSSMACWTIATAAIVTAGDVDVVCTSSSNDATMQAMALAFDIQDWDGLRWNTSAFAHATSGTTVSGGALTTVFHDGISLVFHGVGVTSRTGLGTTTENGVAVDTDDSTINSARVWYNDAEVLELAQIATVGNAGAIDRTQVGFACFGPSPVPVADPCDPAPSGIRVPF